MPRILILGATGYIGNSTALSLLRSGKHTVYGVARNASKAAALTVQEIHPIISPDPVADPSAWVKAIHDHHIDTVVDASGAQDGSLAFLTAAKEAGAARLAAAAKDGTKVQKLGFVYTSGMWVHGSSYAPVSDTDPVGTAAAATPPAKLVGARPKWEQAILSSADVLDVVIVRPALLYGKEAAIWGAVFGPIAGAKAQGKSSAEVALEKGVWPGLVHVDDVGEGFRAAVDKVHLLAGTGVYPVFDLQTSCESVDEIVARAGKALGFAGEVKLVGTGGNLFMEAMSTSLNGDSSRAVQILGWQPKRIGMLRDLETYVGAWAAAAAAQQGGK